MFPFSFKMIQNWQIIIIYLAVVGAVITDIKKREISDLLCLVLLSFGLIYQIVMGNWLVAIATLGLSFLFSLFLFQIGMFGGGDLKLFIALAVFAGLKFCFGVFFYSLLASLPLFAFYMIKERRRKPNVPYAVAILFGVILEQINPFILGGMK